MLVGSSPHLDFQDLWAAAEETARFRARKWPSWGLAGSALLHLAIAAILIFYVPASSPPPEIETAIPVELVRPGAPTASPPQPESAQRPAAAPDIARPTPQPEHEAEAPPPPPIKPPKTEPGLRPDARAELAPPRKPPPPVAGSGTRTAAARPSQQPAPADSDSVSAGPPADTVSVGANPDARGPATYDVKDLIRTQIERRWNFDTAALAGSDLTVSIHLVVDPNGTVESAEIVADPRYATDARYRELAISARDAALVSSPLRLPADALNGPGDMVLRFDPQDVTR